MSATRTAPRPDPVAQPAEAPTAAALLGALDQRLEAAARTLGVPVPDGPTEPGGRAAALVVELLAACPARPGPELWLVLVAIHGAFPTAGAVTALARRLDLDGPAHVAVAELARAARTPGGLALPMRVVTGAPVVDTDICAKSDNHTGIQRVVRETLPRWSAVHRLEAVAVTDDHTAYRCLTPTERRRVFEYRHDLVHDPDADLGHEAQLVVPWRTVVVMPEVASYRSAPVHAGMAQFSGSEVAIVGYDMIPVLSTEFRPLPEAGAFTSYLSIVKHVHRVAGISASATAEFAGFARMLGAQGLPGPVVAEVELAEDVGTPPPPPARRARPRVLALGRREPHKNIETVLRAAEILWRDGLDFELTMLGAHGWDERSLDRVIDRLRADERPLTTLGWVTDEQMWRLIAESTFAVFVSLHEGYGLPVSEALACGTPVVTTDYGSQGEIGRRGGCLLVDPRSVDSVASAMRRLLSNPALVDVLREEIRRRTPRTWDDYAAEAWRFLVEGRLG